MRVPSLLLFAALLLASPPAAAQHPTSATIAMGMATAWRGSGPSGSIQVNTALHALSPSLSLRAGGTGWIALTQVATSTRELLRTTVGIGPSLALHWRPGRGGWDLALGGGVQYLSSRNQNPITIPCEAACGERPAVPDVANARDHGFGAVAEARVALPPLAGGTLELGVVGTRHALFDRGTSWRRLELGIRFGVGAGPR